MLLLNNFKLKLILIYNLLKVQKMLFNFKVDIIMVLHSLQLLIRLMIKQYHKLIFPIPVHNGNLTQKICLNLNVCFKELIHSFNHNSVMII